MSIINIQRTDEKRQMRSMPTKSIKLESDSLIYYSEWGTKHEETIIFLTAKIADTNLLNKAYLNIPNYHVIYLEPQHELQFNLSSTVFDFTNQAFILRRLLYVLNIKSAHIVAESLYSMSAGVLASSYPELVSSLTLISSATKITLTLSRGIVEEFPGSHKVSPAENSIQNMLWETSFTPSNLFNIIEEELSRDSGVENKEPHHSLELSDWSRDARRIKNPTLMIWGSSDDYILKEDRENLVNSISDSAEKVMALCGHWLLHERPDKFFKELHIFLNTIKKP